MPNCKSALAAVMVVLFIGIGSVAAGNEEKVPLDKVPKAVTESVKKRFPEAQLQSAVKETEDGKTVYEVVIKNKNQSIEVTTTPEGAITEIEKKIEAKDLPKPVVASLNSKYPGATFLMIEEVTIVKNNKESLDFYEVLLQTPEKKKWEVSATSAGKLLKEEDKNSEP